jgi:hypothetical protein
VTLAPFVHHLLVEAPDPVGTRLCAQQTQQGTGQALTVFVEIVESFQQDFGPGFVSPAQGTDQLLERHVLYVSVPDVLCHFQSLGDDGYDLRPKFVHPFLPLGLAQPAGQGYQVNHLLGCPGTPDLLDDLLIARPEERL